MKGVRGTDLQGESQSAGLHRMAGRHHIMYLRVAESAGLKGLGSDSTLRTTNIKPELDTRRKGPGQVANFPWRVGESFRKRAYPNRSKGNEPEHLREGSRLQERRAGPLSYPVALPGLLQARGLSARASVCSPVKQDANNYLVGSLSAQLRTVHGAVGPSPWHAARSLPARDPDPLRETGQVPFSISEVAQSCPTLYGPMDCSLPGSSVRGIFQAVDKLPPAPKWGLDLWLRW